MAESSWIELVLRLAAASLCGLVVGWDREAHHKPAGLRTMMLVALGAAAFTLISVDLNQREVRAGRIGFDPLRVIQGIVGGIGFLGAGSIIQARGSVRGVTTAASIWVVGALGIACGLGLYPLAFTLLAFTTVILVVVAQLQLRISRHTSLVPQRVLLDENDREEPPRRSSEE